MSKLKELRIKKGYTQLEIAKVLGIKQSTYSLHELGKSLLNAKQIRILSALYECSTDELLEFNKEDNFKAIQKEIARRLLENDIDIKGDF